jgi:hypothetical protein
MLKLPSAQGQALCKEMSILLQAPLMSSYSLSRFSDLLELHYSTRLLSPYRKGIIVASYKKTNTSIKNRLGG